MSKSGLVAVMMFAVALSGQVARADAQGHETGGGDFYSLEFKRLGAALVNVVKNTGAFESVHLDWQKLDGAVRTTQVECTNDPLELMGVPKDALNFPADGRILFNCIAWRMRDDQKVRAALVLHEYLGILRLESEQYELSARVPAILNAIDIRAASPQYGQASPGASHNYRSLAVNDDGSWSIVGPMFRAPSGENLPLSNYGTSYNGICKLFGFQRFVANSVRTGSSAHGVRIGSDGKFLAYDNDYQVTSLICSNAAGSPQASQNYDSKLSNDDGSVSIVGPAFSSPDGQRLPLSNYGTNYEGICRLFGFARFVENSVRTGSSQFGVRIDSDGKFLAYDADYSIHSLMCTNNPTVVMPSVNYRSLFQNDDGSWSIVGPNFGYGDGQNLPLSNYGTNYDGICVLYGFSRYVRNSVVTGSSAFGVRIDSQGKFLAYDSDYQVASLICER